jgi:hypothetical protein
MMNYQSQISILCWVVELGCLDIYINISLLSSFLVHPQRGHMEANYHIYGYLKHHNHSTMVFDDATINRKDADFTEFDWTDFYQDSKENIPPNAPEPRGNPEQINKCICGCQYCKKLSNAKVSYWYSYIPEYSPHTLVFQGSDHSRIIYIWL